MVRCPVLLVGFLLAVYALLVPNAGYAPMIWAWTCLLTVKIFYYYENKRVWSRVMAECERRDANIRAWFKAKDERNEVEADRLIVLIIKG
jgi:hypothetical protein